MKKKRWIAVAGCSAAVGILVVACVLTCFGRRPYRNLEASDIVSATVHLMPPDQTIQITEVEELTAYLQNIVIYRRDDSYTAYKGQAVTFTLTMADGSQETIMAYNPFVVINGTGYQTKYEPCEQLNHYANQLLKHAE